MAFKRTAQKSKRGLVATTIVALVIASGQSSQAQSLMLPGQPQTMIGGGRVAMLGLRISFGGEVPVQRSATLGLTFGAQWRNAPGSGQLAAYRFLPAAEAGFTLSGETVLKFGTVHIRRSVNGIGVNEAQGDDTFCGRNPGLCIAGVLLGAGLIYLLADEKGQKKPCLYANGCPT